MACNGQYIDKYLYNRSDNVSDIYIEISKNVIFLQWKDSNNGDLYVVGLDINDPTNVLFAKKISISWTSPDGNTYSTGNSDFSFEVVPEDGFVLKYEAYDEEYSRMVLFVYDSSGFHMATDVQIGTGNNDDEVTLHSAYSENYGVFLAMNITENDDTDSYLYAIANNQLDSIYGTYEGWEFGISFSGQYLLAADFFSGDFILVDMANSNNVVKTYAAADDNNNIIGVPVNSSFLNYKFIYQNNQLYTVSSDHNSIMQIADLQNLGNVTYYVPTKYKGSAKSFQTNLSNPYYSLFSGSIVLCDSLDKTDSIDGFMYFDFNENIMKFTENLGGVVKFNNGDFLAEIGKEDNNLVYYKGHYDSNVDDCDCYGSVDYTQETDSLSGDPMENQTKSLDTDFLNGDGVDISDISYSVSSNGKTSWCGAPLSFIPFTRQFQRIRKSGVISYG